MLAVKSMLTQFQKEFWDRLTIPLTRLDSIGIQRVRSRIPTSHNPFHYYDKAIISIDTLKQDAEYRTYLEQAYWDIIVIDEAHNVADRGAGGAKDGTSHGRTSLRSRPARLLARRSDTLIMLSATPHDGRTCSFASLMNMLYARAIADPDNSSKEDFRDKGLVIRRFKKDIRNQVRNAFRDREIVRHRFPASTAEETAYEALLAVKVAPSRSALGTGAKRRHLFLVTLEKALFSSPAACITRVKKRIPRTRILEVLAEKDEQAHRNIGDPSTFMRVYDIEAEEEITQDAIAAGEQAERFDARLSPSASEGDDLLAPFLGTRSPEDEPSPEALELPPAPMSPFESDLAYCEAALHWLRERDRTLRFESDLTRTVLTLDALEESAAPVRLLAARGVSRERPLPSFGDNVMTACRIAPLRRRGIASTSRAIPSARRSRIPTPPARPISDASASRGSVDPVRRSARTSGANTGPASSASSSEGNLGVDAKSTRARRLPSATARTPDPACPVNPGGAGGNGSPMHARLDGPRVRAWCPFRGLAASVLTAPRPLVPRQDCSCSPPSVRLLGSSDIHVSSFGQLRKPSRG